MLLQEPGSVTIIIYTHVVLNKRQLCPNHVLNVQKTAKAHHGLSIIIVLKAK